MHSNLQYNMSQYGNGNHGILSAGLILAWLVTPESMMLVNKGAGMAGGVIIVALAIGAMFAVSSAAVMHNPQLVRHGYDNDVRVMRAVLGQPLGLAAVLSGRVPLLLFASTGMLVSAGFAFNEIFLYWFPNFLFASLLLLCVTLLNIFTRPFALMLQIFSVGLMILGMLVLIVMGFNEHTVVQSSNNEIQQGLTPLLIAMGCVPFLGFDFHRPRPDSGVVYICLTAGLVLLVASAVMAIGAVAPHRLAETTIAHMIVARAVAGELGRYIMGMVVIAGVVAGVNGLFIVMKRLYADIVLESLGPHGNHRSWLVVLVAALAIFTMMMTGMAGEALLESRIRAAIVLWMLYVGLRSACAGHLLKTAGVPSGFFGYLLGCLALLAAGVLAVADFDGAYIAIFVVKILAGMFFVSLVYTMAVAKKKKTDIR
ncbi:MAG: hypothetical protein ABR512_07685 [Desulfopila sp.]